MTLKLPEIPNVCHFRPIRYKNKISVTGHTMIINQGDTNLKNSILITKFSLQNSAYTVYFVILLDYHPFLYG